MGGFNGVDRFELFGEEVFKLIPIWHCGSCFDELFVVVSPPCSGISPEEVCGQVYGLFLILSSRGKEVLFHLEDPEFHWYFASIVGVWLFDCNGGRWCPWGGLFLF